MARFRRTHINTLVTTAGSGEVVSPKQMEERRAALMRQRVRTKPGKEKDRSAKEPWRRTGYGSSYRAARQEVWARQHGRCNKCGAVVAELGASGRWSSVGGEVHHLIPLCDGGSDELSNLVGLCPRCHHQVDAARRSESR